MELLFLRHGQAEKRDDRRGDDEERGLSAEGRLVVADVGQSLGRRHTVPDVILTSPYRRARETAQIFAERLGYRGKIKADARLAPGFTLKQLGKVIGDYHDLDCVLIVGHEPDLSDIVRSLTGGGRITIRKGGLAQVDLPDPRIAKGRLVSLLVPAPVNVDGDLDADAGPDSAP